MSTKKSRATGSNRAPSKTSVPRVEPSDTYIDRDIRSKRPQPAQPGPEVRRGPRKFSITEHETQMRIVEQAMTLGMGTSLPILRRAIADNGAVKISEKRTRRLIELVKLKWAREDSYGRATDRAEQVRRCRLYIRTLMPLFQEKTINASQLRHLQWAEEMLSRLLGTQEPIRVDVSTSRGVAIVEALGMMSDEQHEALLARATRRQRLAEAAEKAGLTIEVEGRVIDAAE